MKRRKPDQSKNYTEEQLANYKKMYEMYDRVYRYLRINVDQDSTAWDLAQETYMKAWRYLDRLEDDRNLYGWISQIARWTLKDHYRKQVDDKKQFFLVEDASTIEKEYKLKHYPPENDPLQKDYLLNQLCKKEDMDRFLEALDQLDDRYAIPMKLWLFDQFSEKEISEITGINYHTVRTRITRGRKLVGKIYLTIKGEGADEENRD